MIAGSLLVHTWQFPAAERAFAQAMDDTDGPLAQIAVTGQRCFARIAKAPGTRVVITADLMELHAVLQCDNASRNAR